MNDISKTDWQALAEMTDEEIDYSDIAPSSAAFFERAGVWRPQPQVTLELQIDKVIEYDGRTELIPDKDIGNLKGFLAGINTNFTREDDRL